MRRKRIWRAFFSAHGSVKDVFILKDRESGRPRGFAFVSMETPEEMNTAIEALNGEEFMGRNLTVNEARPREERGGGGRGFGGGGGRGGYGGGRVTLVIVVVAEVAETSGDQGGGY